MKTLAILFSLFLFAPAFAGTTKAKPCQHMLKLRRAQINEDNTISNYEVHDATIACLNTTSNVINKARQAEGMSADVDLVNEYYDGLNGNEEAIATAD